MNSTLPKLDALKKSGGEERHRRKKSDIAQWLKSSSEPIEPALPFKRITTGKNYHAELTKLEKDLDNWELEFGVCSTQTQCDFSGVEAEYRTYFNFLDFLSLHAKIKEEKLGNQLIRGLRGIQKSFLKMKSLVSNQEPSKKGARVKSSGVQTEPEFSSEYTLETTVEDSEPLQLEELKHLSKKLKDFKLKKLTKKLNDLYENLRKMHTEVPMPSKIPPMIQIDFKSITRDIENSYKVYKEEADKKKGSSGGKHSSISKEMGTQTEQPSSPELNEEDNEDYEREMKYFKQKTYMNRLEKEKNDLENTLARLKKYIEQLERSLAKRETEMNQLDKKNKNLVKETQEEKQKSRSLGTKLEQKKRKVQLFKRNIEEAKSKKKATLNKLNQMHESLYNANIYYRIAEEKNSQIEKAWLKLNGTPFEYQNVDANSVIKKYKIAKFEGEEISEDEILEKDDSESLGGTESRSSSQIPKNSQRTNPKRRNKVLSSTNSPENRRPQQETSRMANSGLSKLSRTNTLSSRDSGDEKYSPLRNYKKTTNPVFGETNTKSKIQKKESKGVTSRPNTGKSSVSSKDKKGIESGWSGEIEIEDISRTGNQDKNSPEQKTKGKIPSRQGSWEQAPPKQGSQKGALSKEGSSKNSLKSSGAGTHSGSSKMAVNVAKKNKTRNHSMEFIETFQPKKPRIASKGLEHIEENERLELKSRETTEPFENNELLKQAEQNLVVTLDSGQKDLFDTFKNILFGKFPEFYFKHQETSEATKRSNSPDYNSKLGLPKVSISSGIGGSYQSTIIEHYKINYDGQLDSEKYKQLKEISLVIKVFENEELQRMPIAVKDELLRCLKNHSDSRCGAECEHLKRAMMIKHKVRGIPYPLKYKNIEVPEVDS